MKLAYKDHEITLTCTETSPNQWELHVAVIWGDDGVFTTLAFELPQRFDTYNDAITHAVLWVKNWIDDGKPDVGLPLH